MIYKLVRIDAHWREYDVVNGFVVRACDEDEAREICNNAHGDEGPVWKNDELTSCVELTDDGDHEIFLCDYHHA